MAESASNIVKSLKGYQLDLKESLKTRDPWERDVELQRNSLRRQYIQLAFHHPYAQEAKDVETHLWMQTSYALITIYRQRLAALDKATQQPPSPVPSGRHPGAHSPGPAEHRKLLQRFRSFLADEEKFWSKFLVHLRQAFELNEAHAALVELAILTNEGDPAITAQPRNMVQFPPLDQTRLMASSTPIQHQNHLATLSKALVCLGDIARYKELYNEAGGRPRAGREDDIPSPRGRGRSKPGRQMLDMIPRARNYDKAERCYKAAHSITPNEGNASHQLGILAMHQKDTFLALYYYYRSLCVRQPYQAASENLKSLLAKGLDHWKKRTPIPQSGPEIPPRIRVSLFKQDVVALHGSWRLGVEAMDTVAPGLNDRLLVTFRSLIAERHLPLNNVIETVIMAQGALWKHRMLRDPGEESRTSASVIESRIARHTLGTYITLMDVGLHQIQIGSKELGVQDSDDLAQKITAPFRRMLPALRLASKWLRANLKYVLQAQSRADEARQGSIFIDNLESFWETYARFMLEISRVFLTAKLPSTPKPLREDNELRGFLPFTKFLASSDSSDVSDRLEPRGAITQSDEHPNEDHLMRIAGLVEDACAIASTKGSVIIQDNLGFAFTGLISSGSAYTRSLLNDDKAVNASVTTHLIEDVMVKTSEQTALVTSASDSVPLRMAPPDLEEDAKTESSHDDPVREAFREALGNGEPDEEDIILFDPGNAPSPTSPGAVMSAITSTLNSPLTPTAPHMSPASPSFHSPVGGSPYPPNSAKRVPETAQDLLDTFNLPSRLSSGDGHAQHPLASEVTSAAQAPLLFGNLPGQSIWSTSPSLGGLKAQSNATGLAPFNGHSRRPSQNNSSFPWVQGPVHAQPLSAGYVVPELPGPPHSGLSSAPARPGYASPFLTASGRAPIQPGNQLFTSVNLPAMQGPYHDPFPPPSPNFYVQDASHATYSAWQSHG